MELMFETDENHFVDYLYIRFENKISEESLSCLTTIWLLWLFEKDSSNIHFNFVQCPLNMGDTMCTRNKNKSIFIACQGTRGDIQPYVNLGTYLLEQGWSVLIGAPPEFRDFVVKGYRLEFLDIGESPTHAMYSKSVADDTEGRKYRSNTTKPLAAYRTTQQLFNPPAGSGVPITKTWFQRILSGCRGMQPDILMLVFTSWCGAAVIPHLLGHQTRVVLSLPMPMAPSSEFSVSMAGTGYSLCCSLFNRWQWAISERMIVQGIHMKGARKVLTSVIAEEEAAGRHLPGAGTVTLDERMGTSGLSTIFVYSPALLPKPADWPQNYHVVGQLLKKRRSGDSHKALPAVLQAYLDDCRNKNLQVMYIGFGSLSFFPEPRVTAILDAMVEAVKEIAVTQPVRAIIQTTLSSTPGKTGNLSSSHACDVSKKDNPYFVFSESVDHEALFPQVACVVSHGGAGTVQTALASGKPVVCMCCLPTADQSFWADLCYRRR